MKTAAIALLVLLATGAYASRFVYRGWIPHDEGTIAQSAERVLSGELPHRDFDDVYTGGLTYLHAGAMKIFGVNLRASRLTLFGFFLAFVTTAHAVARRVASPTTALVATALAVVWSVPNYFVSLPSWYNLFFATFGVYALLRFLESDRRVWLVAAGVSGGLSVLAKISGLFYIAGALLFLAYLESMDAARSEDAVKDARAARFWIVLGVPLVVCVLLFAKLLSAASTAAELVEFFLPVLLLCGVVEWSEWKWGHGAVWTRIGRVFRLAWPFLAGAAAPLALFVLVFWRQGALADLFRGVFVLPQLRLSEASLSLPRVGTLGLAAPYAALLLLGGRRSIRSEWQVTAGLTAALGIVLTFAHQPIVYRVIWSLARSMPLLATVAGVWMLARDSSSVRTAAWQSRARLFLLVAMAAMVALVQFPYATPTYFCYAAPMTILALAAIVSAEPQAPRRIHVGIASFFFMFAVLFVNRSYGWNLGVQFIPYHPDSRLEIDRGGLWVPAADKQDYEALVRVVREHAAGGTIVAGPDCPEVYFLTGLTNPTHAIFDFFNPEREDEAWIQRLLATDTIHAAVINTSPLFSPPMDDRVQALLARRFPDSQRIGRFLVRFECHARCE